MKSKPVKHKTTNTFRFVPFAERINAIDIRHAALYHIEHVYTQQRDENETHFNVALQKWHVLNITENFKKFRKEVFGVITISQLVHKQQEILETLERYLSLGDPLCLQPLLEILVSLAKDLRENFYPYFPKFLDILIKLLNTKDAEQLEWTLICLAFLFKVLKPYLKKDIALVLTRIIPLLSESQPQYINNFAAESFAFVAKDIHDKKKFIVLVLNYLETHEDAITGCGHLIFEILRGVSEKFHSCAEVFLPILFQHLKDSKEHQDILFKVLTQTIEDSLKTISRKEYGIFWTNIANFMEVVLKEQKEDSFKFLEYILRLAGQVIEHGKGKYVTDPQQFISLLIQTINIQFSETILEVCSQIGVLLLLSPNILLDQIHAGSLVRMLLSVPYPNVLINFIQNIVDYSHFDMNILPKFLKYVVLSEFDNDAMSTLAKICVKKSPLSMNGIKLFEWVKYPINFGAGLNSFMLHFDSVISEDVEKHVENPFKLTNVLFCLPHVEKIDVDDCIKNLGKLVSKLLNILVSYNLEDKSKENKYHSETTTLSTSARKTLFLLTVAMESIIHTTSCKRLKGICEIDVILPVLLPLAADPNYLCALHLLDLYLTVYEHESGMTYPHLSLVDSYLRSNVSSPFHVVRLITTHIYKLFENVEELNKTAEIGGSIERFSVFSNCFAVESITPSIQEYRAQVNILRKMAFNTTQYALAKDTDFHLFALNYMLGILYANFKLLWEPVIEFIAAYGNALNVDDFWPTFHKALEFVFLNGKKNLKQFRFDDEIETEIDTLQDLYSSYNSISERPDLFNYRNLILKIMTNCIQVCEERNRDVVVLFLKFIDEEYRRNDNMNALKIDVEVHDSKMEIDSDKTEENDENIDEMIEAIDDDKETVSGKIIFKTLINVMQVLAQFKNPRALHKEPIFWELYMEFLKHKNPGLQKYALDCVLNYKNKSVVPYKNNLCNLVDEKKFKDELTKFKITEDANDIQPHDREHVVPIILRILYGKMTAKLVAEKKSGGQTRRSLVMRYLAGCNENEIKIYIEMAFSYHKQYLEMRPREMFDSIVSNIDLKSITIPGKLHSMLNLFEVTREYFGGYMKEELLSKFLNVFYSICSTIHAVLSQADRVHVGYVKVMKNLRVLALSTLKKIFEQFVHYPWSKDELYVVFETLIWPLIPRLHFEGVHTPTVLLKLLNVWSQNPRYYVLLITSSDKDEICPLPAIFKLLLAPKAAAGVVSLILDMIEKLLTLTEDEEDKEIAPIESFNTITVEDTIENINFGSKILIPHIPSILEIMKRRMAISAKSNTVNKRDLLILSRVTELVASPELCDELLKLLLPILVKKVCMNMAEENMEYAVNTIVNLLGHSLNPQIYIKNIAVLFNKVGQIPVRKLLMKLLSSLAETASVNNVVLARMAEVITEMNAFNKRWIEQPDFDRRIDAYKKIFELLEGDEIDVDLTILIVNNCFYFMRTEKDIGLRDSAGLCLKRILPKLLMKYRSTNDGLFLVRDTVLALISAGIRDTKNENIRNECIALLGELVRECPEADVVLSDLAPLINKEDREVDFFDNMCHLQMHRRVRALMKFCKVAKKMTKCPTPRTLTNFILPLVSMYICNEKYTDKNTLIDACIDVTSTCCRLLPWYHYEVILKLYLNKMRHSSEYQKQLTRIIIGVTEAFHFDFSKIKSIDLPKALTMNVHKFAKIENKTENEETVDKVTDENETIESNENDDIKEDFEVDEDKELQAEDDEIEEETQEDEPNRDLSNVPAFDRMTHVSPSVAKRIIKSLTIGLLPQLNRAIGKITQHEESHKVNRHKTGFDRQEEDMLRVPIALALVKLLQRLPGDLLNHQLPGILIKLCSFLKSPLKQVRITARDIVKKIMITVGPAYLGVLLEHLTLLLTRGFQVHVLVATIHTVLDALKTDFKAGDLNENLDYILDVCTNDLFGAVSEEKEVDKLHYKTPEAKPSKKSYVTLMIVAQNITENCLINLILPFKEVLGKYHSKKTVLKVQEALLHISTGLVNNKFIEMESLFIFLHGIASESIPDIVLGVPKREISEAQREKMLRAKPDSFIIPEIPKRNKESQAKHVKVSGKVNAHVLVEFSLNLLFVILKGEKVSRMDCRAFVDPLVPLLVDALNGDHVKVTTIAMKCIAMMWTMRISTPALEANIKDIVTRIFWILHKYATAGISQQSDNYDLVRTAFKAVTMLIRNVKYYKLELLPLQTLLLYADEDIENAERQSNAFSLLKAIIEARLEAKELHKLMKTITHICVTSESAKSREEARVIFVNYLLNYPPGKRLERHIDFFVTQLNYEMQHGRESSLKVLEMIINKLNVSQIAKHGGHLLVSLGLCMFKDSSTECKVLAANCIEAMLTRFPLKERNKLFDLVIVYLEDSLLMNFEYGTVLCVRFVNVEKEEFKNRLDKVLSLVSSKMMLLSNNLTVGRFVKMKFEHSAEMTDEEKQEEIDSCLIQTLALTHNITVHCGSSLNNPKFCPYYDDIGQECKALLANHHSWVRLMATKILEQLLLNVDVGLLDNAVKNNSDTERGFLYDSPEDFIKGLVLDLCAQYTTSTYKEMVEQVTAVLFLIIKMVHSMTSFKLDKTLQGDNEETEGGSKVNIRWILFRLRKAINVEVSGAPGSMIIRTSIFTMWTHIISLLETEDVNRIIDVILPPIVRELSTGDIDTPASVAKQLAGRLGKKLRRKIGEIEYSKLVAEAQNKLNIKRAERKKLLLQEKVNNPERAAKRKLQLKDKKKQTKKAKLEMLHGKRPRKRKAEDINLEDDIITY